ncbi:MAG: hypothetical protein HFE45_12625 [Oscillospiraceae bacterium]|nr:hypothetical protein [Oscillospiraceae bacterium]
MRKKRFLQRLTAAFLMLTMAFSAPTAAFAEGMPDFSEAGVSETIDLSEDFEIEDSDFDELPEISEEPLDGFEENAAESDLELFADGDGVQQMTTHTGYKYYHVTQGVEANWGTVTIGGQLAYCVDMTNFHTRSGIRMNSSTTYSGLSEDQRYMVGHVVQLGAQDAGNILHHMATQVLIWEIIHGRLNLSTLEQTNTDIYDGVIGYNPGAASYYSQLVTALKAYERVPSFMSSVQSAAPSHQATGSETFEVTLQNTASCSLSDFHFSSVDGVEFAVEGQNLKISVSKELTGPVLVRAYKEAAGQTNSLLFWSQTDQQTRATALETKPVPAYFYLSTSKTAEVKPSPPETSEPEEPEDYHLEINKVETGTDKPLKGAVFQVRHVEHGVVGDAVTDQDGRAEMTLPWAGGYLVTETTPPERHLLDENPTQDVVVNKENPEASVTFSNRAYTRLLVRKVDAGNSRPLAGAVIEIQQIDGDIRLTGTTDRNGEVEFTELPPNTSWRVVEKQAPAGYHLNEEVFTAELIDGQPVTITIPDKIKTGLVIRKVDAETGEPLAGAVFTVTRSGGGLIGEYISDSNGLVVVESLTEDTYIVEEIQPPEGYLLDGENARKTVKLSWENSQELVFRDYAKPKLLLKKIDADTGDPLSGAVIRVAKRGSSEYTEVTTGRDGSVLLEGLDEDWYRVQEIRSPTGYLLEDTVHDVELRFGETTSVVLPNRKAPALRIRKIRAEDGAALAGAVFRVTLPNGTMKDVTADVNGIAELSGLEAESVVVTEIKAPDGYLLDGTEHHVRLEAGKTAEITVQNSRKPSLKIRKIDSVTKQPMKGVKFSIAVQNGKPLGEFLTNGDGEIFLSGLECDLEAGTILLVKEIASLDGYLLEPKEKEVLLEAGKITSIQFENQPLNPILIKKVDQDGKPLSGVKFRVKRADGQYVGEFVTGISGLATVAGQQPGFFIIEEIETAEGYILDSTPKTVQLREDKPAEVEFVNHRAGTLLIKKVNAVDGSALAGAAFKVTTSEGTLLGEVTSGTNGYATLSGLQPGTLIVSEIKSPKGFILDSTPRTVVLKKNETAVVEIANTPMSTLEIQKVDSVTGKPLAGISFQIEKLSGERIGSFVTDASGRIVLPNLTAQWLIVRETATLKGYRLDSKPVNVEVKAGKTTVVKFKNQPYPVLDVLKVDAETGKPLAGVQFKLLDSDQREVGVFTTNARGRITLTGLEGGKTVYLQEIKAPDGYLLDETLHRVKLEWGKTHTLKIRNQKIYGQLEILKVAADESKLAKVQEGAVLAGAVFEIYDAKGKLADRMTTDTDGRAVSVQLPVGKYTGREVSAPKFFLLNTKEFTFEVTEQEQQFKLTVKDESKKPEVTIEKRGNVEAQPGQTMTYTLSEIANRSNCSLDDFYFEDVLPTEVVRLNAIHTGTFNEILNYRVTYQTNLSSRYRVLADNLSSQISHTLSCAVPGLAANEYITAVRFEFGTVQEGFTNLMEPVLEVLVLSNLTDGQRIQNTVTISGECDSVPIYDRDRWVTVVVDQPRQGRRTLPKTGIWGEESKRRF